MREGSLAPLLFSLDVNMKKYKFIVINEGNKELTGLGKMIGVGLFMIVTSLLGYLTLLWII